jgi:hypothetical protein
MTRTGIALAMLAALWLVAVHAASFGTVDTTLRLRMTHAWWTGGSEVLVPQGKPATRGTIEYGVRGRDGRRFIAYDPGQSLLMLPADWAATKLVRWVPAGAREEFVNWFTFVPLNVLLVLSCFWLLRLFGFEERLAGAACLVWLLATTVLPYAQVAFQNNQILLCVIASHACVLEWVKTRRCGFIVVSGAVAAFSVLIRLTAVIHVATLGAFLLICLALVEPQRGEKLKVIACWLVALVPVLFAGRIFDELRYGSFFTTGQMRWVEQINTDPLFAGLPPMASGFPFTHPGYVGVLGVMFSPAKSLFLYDPLLAPCLVIGVLALRAMTPYVRWYTLLAAANLVVHLWLTSRLDFWHGDWAWAARYHITSVAADPARSSASSPHVGRRSARTVGTCGPRRRGFLRSGSRSVDAGGCRDCLRDPGTARLLQRRLGFAARLSAGSSRDRPVLSGNAGAAASMPERACLIGTGRGAARLWGCHPRSAPRECAGPAPV